MHPGFLLGPPLSPYTQSNIAQFKQLFDREGGAVPSPTRIPVVDVRDCAQAHVNALMAPPGFLHLERLIICTDSCYNLGNEILNQMIGEPFRNRTTFSDVIEASSNLQKLLEPFFDNYELVIPG